MDDLSRYSISRDKNRFEEVVLLQGTGCFWKRCRFCDYYLDINDKESIIRLNQKVLNKVTGKPGWLTVINSGSFFELPEETIELIKKVVKENNIKDLSIESHLKYIDEVAELKEEFKNLGVKLHPRIGIETFDEQLREGLFNKGFGSFSLEKVKQVFDECCLLYGIKGQNRETLLEDIKTATQNFDDVYLNIYEQRTGLEEDPDLKQDFIRNLYPTLEKIDNLHILINNTDLGVG